MTTGVLSPLPRWREFTNAGVVAPGAKLNWYVAGTSTRATTYSDRDLATIHENSNPMVASSSGLFGPIYLQFGVIYDVVLTDENDVEIWSQDGVGGTGVEGETFDVTAYGATGNGVTDDTAAIQSAITAAAVAGGVVYFPKGTYRCTAALTCTASHVRFQGAGRDEAVLKWDDNATEGLQITGPATSAGSPLLSANAAIGDYAIIVASSAGLAIGQTAYLQDNSSFHGTLLTGIRDIAGTTVTLENALPIGLLTADAAQLIAYTAMLTGIAVRDLSFTCSGGAATANKLTLLDLTRCVNVDVERCRFDGSVGPLITTRALKGGSIADCVFKNALTVAGSAVEAQTSTALSIVNCQTTQTQFGFVAARSPRTKIVDCSASTIVSGVNIGRAVKISNGSNFSTVAGVPGSDANLTGVRFENAAYCSITGCTVAFYAAGENGAGGIGVSGAAATTHHITISGNTIVGGSANAAGITLVFDVAGLDTFCTVVGNNISGCKRYGIYCGSNHNVLAGNQIGSQDGGALVYVPALCGYNIIDDNIITAEGGSVAASIHTVDGIGHNIIGINKWTTSVNLDALDTVVATSIWKPMAATQTAVHTGANTTETTAWDYTIPGGTFVDSLASGFRHTAVFNFAANANDKTIKYKLGTTLTITFAITGANANDANVVVTIDAFLNAGTMVVEATCLAMLPAGTLSFISLIGGSSTDDFTADVHSKFTMTNGTATANDMNFEQGKFVYDSVIIRPTPAS